MNHQTAAVAGLLAAAVALSAQAQSPSTPAAAARPAFARVDLPGVATNAGRIGYAHLVFRAEGTDVLVQVPPTNNVTRPMHLYTSVHEGTCGNLGPQVTAATRRVLGYRESSGSSSVRNTIPLTKDALRAGPHALAVRSGPQDGNHLLYCGDLREL